jgi:hypothetical protein
MKRASKVRPSELVQVRIGSSAVRRFCRRRRRENRLRRKKKFIGGLLPQVVQSLHFRGG